MNPINLNVGGEIDPKRGATRVEPDRVTEGNADPRQLDSDSARRSDSINVSDRAAAIGELAAKADQLPEVRQERVEQLRTLVQSGDYHPPAADIADAILKDGTTSREKV